MTFPSKSFKTVSLNHVFLFLFSTLVLNNDKLNINANKEFLFVVCHSIDLAKNHLLVKKIFINDLF